MARWQIASAVFFAYLFVTALTLRGLTRRARLRLGAGVVAAFVILLAGVRMPADSLLNVLFIPATLLVVGYWLSGLLFVRPMPAAERWLVSLDDRFRIQAIAARTPRPIVEVLEIAYAIVYPLVPAALFFALRSGVTPDRFWSVVLATDYVCFAALAWVQTRPPRSLGYPTPWTSSFRAINLRALSATSIQVNTFPSGHAAEALACALLASGAPWPVSAGMFACALAISAGAVFGRYHYAADAVAGWLVALLVYLLL